MEFAAHQFKLNARQHDGCTLREHLQVVWNATGTAPDELVDAPDMPESMAHVWQFFCELHRTRSSNGFGANCISYTEIESWMNVTKTELYPYELQAIMAVDEKYMSQVAEESKKDK